MTTFLFWTALGTVAYTYVLYPLLLMLRALFLPRPVQLADITPTVTLIVCARNEVEAIGEKLRNLGSLDYPPDRLEILIASDGSTDGTDDIVRSCPHVRLLTLPREGKIPTLNTAVAEANGEILVFSDANSMYAPNALRALVRPFSDASVGGVAGDQRYLSGDGTTDGARGERAYWSLDRQLKEWQSRAGSATSATGAIYAIRRSLFREVPLGVTDDFAISTNVVAQGYRLLFCSEAVAYEPVAVSDRTEFGRKVRIMTRGLSGVVARRELLNPFRHGFYAIQIFSHKVLRRLVAVPLVLLLLLTPFLWRLGPLYEAFAIAQLGFYACAGVGWVLAGSRLGRSKVFALPRYFCLVNSAALMAALNVLGGRRIDLWEPQRAVAASDRAGDAAGALLPKA